MSDSSMTADAAARECTTAWPLVLRAAVLGVQLAMLVPLARWFRLESPAFYQIILPFALGGAVVNHLLPRRHRPAFFGVAGLAGVLLVFGVGAGAWLIGLGVMLIALCHLPIGIRWRIALVGVAGLALAAMRAGWLTAPWPGVIWPILGSMFMFRLAIYLYDLRHGQPAEPGLTLSYFFLLPNVVFPLFPVIDYHTFRRTYYDRDALQIYEQGARWIFRGFAHLLAYRLVYHHVMIPPAEIDSTAELVRYLIGNFGLYLRVSGQFHLVVGLLHLYGFRLPETHRFFYLASSFSDLWRRINIYWKDFMQKTVYLPVVFGLKRRGEATALVVATAAVIVATWLLHSYQWFWLLGDWLITGPDMAFWALIGMFLVVNVLLEQRRGRQRQFAPTAGRRLAAWRHAAQTAGMFALMCILWGLWTSPSLDDATALFGAVTLRGIDVLVVVGALTAVATTAFVCRRWAFDAPTALAGPRAWTHPLIAGMLPLLALWALGRPAMAQQLPLSAQAVLRDLRVVELNRADADQLQRGYYEEIVGVNRRNGQLWELYMHAEAVNELKTLGELHATISHRGELAYELRPMFTTIFKGATLSTNQYGMRDREYALEPARDARRIALLGPSYVMGSGVADGETFEALVEERLNREWRARTGLRYELLNFAVVGYALAQQALILENGRVGQFKPEVVVLVSHEVDFQRMTDYVYQRLDLDDVTDPAVLQVIEQAEVHKGLSRQEVNRRLRPYEAELVRWALDRAAAAIGRLNAIPIVALIPQPSDRWDRDKTTQLAAAAADAGFAVIDMTDVYDAHDQAPLGLSLADRHPNWKGHRVIAERFYRELTARPSLLAANGRE